MFIKLRCVTCNISYDMRNKDLDAVWKEELRVIMEFDNNAAIAPGIKLTDVHFHSGDGQFHHQNWETAIDCPREGAMV